MKSERVDAIDILRGMALLGILLTHVITQFFGVFPVEQREVLNFNVLDKFVTYFVSLFFGGKFFLIFSLLFGMSFILQFEHYKDRLKSFNFWFLRRLLVLLCFGFVHYLFFQGDILIIYAMIGSFLLFARLLSNKVLLIISFILLSGLPRVLLFLWFDSSAWVKKLPLFMNPERIFNLNFTAATSFNLSGLMQFNMENWADMVSIFQLGYFSRGYQVLGCFLLGIFLMRVKVFDSSLFERIQVKRWIVVLLGLSLLSLGGSSVLYFLNPSFRFQSWSSMTMLCLYDYFNYAFTGVIFLSLLSILRSSKGEWLGLFRYAGKMSLTVYISQSLIFTFLFFHWGLNLFARFGSTISLLLGLGVFVLQAVTAKIWLSKFRQGPLEKVWRILSFSRNKRPC